jgi:translation initiation factor IF-2
MSIEKPKRLFKVASEFNVSTQSIVDTLGERDFEVANRPNTKITPEMYAVLLDVYGDDRVKSLEHEKSREEYESRRSQMLAGKDERVTIDSFLEPLDEPGLEPAGLEPVDLEPEEPKQPKLEPVELEPADVEPADLEPLSEEPASVEPEDLTPEAPLSADQKPAETAQDEAKPAEVLTPTGKSAVSDTTKAIKPSEGTEPSEIEETSKKEDAQITELAEEKESQEPGSEPHQPDEKEEDEIIRGSAKKLKGTKVVGKVATTFETEKKVKKRKRKKDREEPEQVSTKTDTATDAKKGKKAGKKSKKRKSSVADEEGAEKKLKETLLKIQEGGAAGKKRQKRRKQRREDREEELQFQQELEDLENDVIDVTEFITVSDLADLLDVSPTDIITSCMTLGMMVSINQRLDASAIELVAAEYDTDVNFVDADEATDELLAEEEDAPEDLEPRSPIITVMGHVDHGKTSLLDYIRKTKVAAGEAGGITQHVGAYEVETDDGKRITFLDTPGHEAFTAMRSRGAQATDIVILVVAADDSVMPQTIEAINHAKAAGVPMIIAINKMDKEGANPDRIKGQLSEHGVIVEEYGGSTQVAEVSAHTGMGIADLLDKVLIEAELLELKANPNRNAQGIILESRIDKGKGTVANVLIQNGTLKVGDPFVAGSCFGRVRAMENEKGQRIQQAGPSTPLQLTGFDETPQAGDRLVVPKDERTAKEIATQRQQIRREQSLRNVKHLTLDDLSRRMALGEVSELNIIIKADVDGSIEALSGALQKLGSEEVSVNIIHTGSGAITESDVLLASASDAIIIGFQVRPTAAARKLAEAESIDVRLFSVIYDAVDEVHDALEGMLSPEISEEIKAMVSVRDIFKVSKVGTIAGCYVTEGKVTRNNPIRVIRDGVVIYEGRIDSLKRFKEDVREVQSGYECGISIENFNDIKVGDEFESYTMVESKRKLSDVN